MAVGLYAVGRHLTQVTLIPQAANTNGIFTPGTAITITGLVDEMNPELEVNDEEISPITTERDNFVALSYGTRMMVAEILTTPGYVANVRGPQLLGLKATLLAVSFCQVLWVHGNTSHEFLGSFKGMSAPWQGKGKKIVVARFNPIDYGVNNWVTS